jgi:hypothetical protein
MSLERYCGYEKKEGGPIHHRTGPFRYRTENKKTVRAMIS